MSLAVATLAGGVLAVGGAYAYLSRNLWPTLPGPGSYPVVGSYFHVEHPIEQYLYKNYPNDDIVLVRMGTCNVYFLNTYQALKEAYIQQADIFTGRPFTDITAKLISEGVGGIIQTDGETWKEYRRFTLKCLRDFGFGRKGVEEKISTELGFLTETIDKSLGSPVETGNLMSISISNIVCQLVFGCRLASEEQKFHEILELMLAITQDENTFTTNCLIFSIENSWLKRFGSFFSYFVKKGAEDILKTFRRMMDYCEDQVNKHKKEFQEGDEPRDLIDMNIRQEKTSDRPQLYNTERLSLIIVDLFIAGTDTTSNTLRWGLLYMIKHTEVAEKVYKEIMDNIGKERFPAMTDKSQLNYTLATLDEIQRLATLVPLSLNHRNIEPCVVAGYSFPKDSIFSTSVYSIHRDPNVFPEPHEFKPEIFLDPQGRYTPIENLIPFGVGKRSCLGESLARMELFMFFTTLMQRYKFHLDPEDSRSLEDILQDPTNGVIRAPRKHKIIFSSR